ncbi:MAG: hypothetical protein WCV62_03120 [Candidatus Peribacteraceae bacterium]
MIPSVLFAPPPRRLPLTAAHRRGGFLLVEVMMGIALFAMFLMSAGLVLMNGQEGTEMAGDRVRATFLSERSLEATRDLRGVNFSSLTDGQHGVLLGASGKWEFAGSETDALDGYKTNVQISTPALNVRRIVAQTKWKHGIGRSGSLVLTSELADWRSTCAIGDWANLTEEWRYAPGGNPTLKDIAVVEDRAYVVSGVAPALHILNLSTHATSTYDYGGLTATAVVAKGRRLYLLTSDVNAELRVLSVENLSSPSPLNPVVNVNIAGTPTSLAIKGNTLYVGLTNSANPEILSFNISNSGAVTPLKQGQLAPQAGFDVKGIAVAGTGAFLALSDGGMELGITDTTHANLNPNSIHNLTAWGGDQPSQSVAVSGSGLLIGCQKNAATSQSPAWYSEIVNGAVTTFLRHLGSGSITGVSLDPHGKYAFLAAVSGRKALQVVSIANFTGAGELKSFNATSPAVGQDVLYDPVRDRLYLVTSRDVIILRPGGASTRPCT